MHIEKFTQLKNFLCNVEVNNAGLPADGEEKFRFMNGRESMFSILNNKEGER
jgi:hypothetical protein